MRPWAPGAGTGGSADRTAGVARPFLTPLAELARVRPGQRGRGQTGAWLVGVTGRRVQVEFGSVVAEPEKRGPEGGVAVFAD